MGQSKFAFLLPSSSFNATTIKGTGTKAPLSMKLDAEVIYVLSGAGIMTKPGEEKRREWFFMNKELDTLQQRVLTHAQIKEVLAANPHVKSLTGTGYYKLLVEKKRRK